VSAIHHSTIHLSSLVIGHICHDKIPDGYTPGGAAAYAGLLTHRLGHPTKILTSFGPDFQFASQFEGLDLHVVPSATTTVFENIYQPDGQRIQYLHSRASLLTPADLPKHWQSPNTALLGPICDEVSFEFLDFFAAQNTVTCACPQGWMRQWDAQHRVSPKPIADWSVLAKADLVSMSEADVGCDWELIRAIAKQVPLLVVTQGAAGATVFEAGVPTHYPAQKVEEKSPTGAGDVFAASLLLRFAEGRDVVGAVEFARGVAANHVKGDFSFS
jgi:sugar/nucleoside kinase (ribokinase family)